MAIDPTSPSSTPQKNYSDPEIRCLHMLLDKYLNVSSESEGNRDTILKAAFSDTIPLKDRIALVDHALLNSKNLNWEETIPKIANTFNEFSNKKNTSDSFISSLNAKISTPKISLPDEKKYKALLAEASIYSSPTIKSASTSPAKKTKSPNPVVGLKNNGQNICFMNVAFQIIMNDPPLRDALVKTYTFLSETEPTNKAYKTFLDAVTAYQERISQDIDLLPLRALATDPTAKQEKGNGDAFEFIQALLTPVNRDTNPNLFFPTQLEKTYEASSFQTFADNEGKGQYDLLPPSGVSKKSELTSTIILKPTTPEALDGQSILNSHFSRIEHQDDPQNHTIYKENNQDKKFYLKAEHLTLEQAPPQFMIDLKHHTFLPTEEGGEIKKKINMPEEITLPLKDGSTQKYKLKSIGVHTGAHYYSLIKKPGQEWMMANDSDVHLATPEEITQALGFGDIYSYEKIPS